MKIEVLQEDIDNAAHGEITIDLCPVALAIVRTLKKPTTVSQDTIYVKDKDTMIRYIYRVSQTVADFITSFDRGEKVKPFSFEIDNPEISTLLPEQI